MTAADPTTAAATVVPPGEQAEQTPSTPQPWVPARRHRLVTSGSVLLAIVAICLILAAWELPPFHGMYERTDNAYVRGRTTVIAPQVSGYVVRVLIRDYENVRAGQVLVRIDDSTYRARVAQAKANLDAQLAALANSTQARASRVAGLGSQAAGILSAQAQLAKARADMARADDLVKDGSISIRERDQTLAALTQAEAQLRQAHAANEIGRQDVRTVDVNRDALKAQVEAARATLRLAEIDLAHCAIVAPEDGQVGEIGVRLGQFVTSGTQLLSLVPPDRWIIANFRETQTRRMAPGQHARVTIDALGGDVIGGVVERMSPAAGSEFAVLKPDNATGNFVKVPQRIGVRILIDHNSPLPSRLRPGMSAEVAIDATAER